MQSNILFLFRHNSVMLRHDLHKLFIARFLRIPAEHGLSLSRVAEKVVHIGRAEPCGIYADEHFPRLFVIALFVKSLALPTDAYAVCGKRTLREVADCVLYARRDDEVVRLVLLHDEPHTLDVIFCISQSRRLSRLPSSM